MPLTTGLLLNGYRSLAEVCAPLAADLERCFWIVDLYSGPFHFDWLYPSEENEALADASSWHPPAFPNPSTPGFRPGTIPRLADRLVIDEWSYYFAIDSPQDIAARRATLLAKHIGDLTEPFLRDLDKAADLFFMHVDGWWEFYTARPDWLARLRAAWPDAVLHPLNRAGNPPPIS